MRYKTKGSLTAFASIVSSALLLLGLVSAALVEHTSLQAVARSTARTALESGLSHRQLELLSGYGLYATQTKAVANEADRVVQTVFGDVDGTQGYPAEGVAVSVEPSGAFATSEQLEAQINMLMLYTPESAVSDGARQINEQIRTYMTEQPYVHKLADHKLPQYIGKLLGTVQEDLLRMEKKKDVLKRLSDIPRDPTAIAAATPYITYVQSVQRTLVQIEELWPSFETCLAQTREQTTDDVFVINDYFGEIYREDYRQIKTVIVQQLQAYEQFLTAWEKQDPLWQQYARTVSQLAEQYPTLVEYSLETAERFYANGTQVDALLSSGEDLFGSVCISFAYEPFDTEGATNIWDSYDAAAASVFEDVDTWREEWYVTDILDQEYHLKETYLEKVERIMSAFPIASTEEDTENIDRYILKQCIHQQTKETDVTVTGERITENPHAIPFGEVEYILVGSPDAAVNHATVFARILAMRFLENYAVLAMDFPKENDNPHEITYAYCDMYSLVAQNFRRALAESYLETYRMVICGDRIPLHKTHDTMVLQSTNRLAQGVSLDTVTFSYEEEGVTVGYEEYLMWMLSATQRETKLMRLATVINEDLALRTNGEAPDIRELFTSFDVTVVCDAVRFSRLAVMPGSDRKGSLFATVRQRYRGGYIL